MTATHRERYYSLIDNCIDFTERRGCRQSIDRGEKLAAYGKAGINEYWLVNLPDGCVEVFRDPHITGYSSSLILKPGDTASPAAFPDVKIDVAALLRKPAP